MKTDKLFTGQREMAGLGIYHYGARFYSPKLGRFLSADTIVPGYANPQSLNRYSYVINNPLRYTDPTGHAWDDCKGRSDVQCKRQMQRVGKIKGRWAAEQARIRTGNPGALTARSICITLNCGSGDSNPFGGSYGAVTFGGGTVGGGKGLASPVLAGPSGLLDK